MTLLNDSNSFTKPLEFNRTKAIGFLTDLLSEHQIETADEFRELIAGKASIGTTHPFRILRANDLHLDSEHRLFDTDFVYRSTIFDCPGISLQNSQQIDLRDCVVLGFFRIGRKSENKLNAYIDTCIIEDILQVNANGNDIESLTLNGVRALELKLSDFSIDQILLSDNQFGNTTLARLNANHLQIYDCELGTFETSDCHLKEVSFSREQINPYGQVGHYGLEKFVQKYFFRRKKFKPFDPKYSRETCDDYLDRRVDEDRLRRCLETFDFLLNRTELRYNKRTASHIKYLRALAESQSCVSRAFVFATGAFVKPYRMLVLSATIIAVFAVAYCFAIFATAGNSLGHSIDLAEALYFSGITFTTVGYGDILPLGWARGFSVVEAFMGIVMSSGFAVSVARRYIE